MPLSLHNDRQYFNFSKIWLVNSHVCIRMLFTWVDCFRSLYVHEKVILRKNLTMCFLLINLKASMTMSSVAKFVLLFFYQLKAMLVEDKLIVNYTHNLVYPLICVCMHLKPFYNIIFSKKAICMSKN